MSAQLTNATTINASVQEALLTDVWKHAHLEAVFRPARQDYGKLHHAHPSAGRPKTRTRPHHGRKLQWWSNDDDDNGDDWWGFSSAWSAATSVVSSGYEAVSNFADHV